MSDSDQTASDSDQTASDSDQTQAEADQRASNRDQSTADRDHAASTSTEPFDSDTAYEASRAERNAGTIERSESGRAREAAAAGRMRYAASRDEQARERDRVAELRDRAAEAGDRAAEHSDRLIGLAGPDAALDRSAQDPRDVAADLRARAAGSRTRAAADRERAARDRAEAARDRELAQAALEKVQAQKMQAVGELAGGIAHEFSNLLMIISGYARMLATRTDVAAAREDAEQIIVAADRAADITRQLLTFAHMSPSAPSSLDPSRAIAELEPALRQLLGARARLYTRLDPGVATILIDRGEFAGMVANLVHNAVEAMPDGGMVTVRTGVREIGPDDPVTPGRKPGRHATITVSDTGAGIPADARERIFEPFFTTKRPAGVGLGLATTQSVVDRAGGWIEVETEVGHGSTFDVILPETAAV